MHEDEAQRVDQDAGTEDAQRRHAQRHQRVLAQEQGQQRLGGEQGEGGQHNEHRQRLAVDGPRPVRGLVVRAAADGLAGQRGGGDAEAQAGQHRHQREGHQHVRHRQLLRADLPDDPEQRREAGREEELLHGVGQAQPQQAGNIVAAGQAAQQAVVGGHAQADGEVDGGADDEAGGGADGGTGDSQRRQTEVPEDQRVADQHVQDVHRDDGNEVVARPVHGAPVAAEREVHAHEGDRHQPDHQVGAAGLLHCRVVVEQRHDRRRGDDHERTQRQADRQRHQQPAVERGGGLARTAGAESLRGDALHRRRQPGDEGHRHEHQEAGKADAGQRGGPERADHPGIDQIEHVLRRHAADDGQRLGMDAATPLAGAEARVPAAFGHAGQSLSRSGTRSTICAKVAARRSGWRLPRRVWLPVMRWRSSSCSVVICAMPCGVGEAQLCTGGPSRSGTTPMRARPSGSIAVVSPSRGAVVPRMSIQPSTR